MPREIITLTLQRPSENQPWGFRIVGGTDEALILKVEKVSVPFVSMCICVSILPTLATFYDLLSVTLFHNLEIFAKSQ